MSHSKKYSDRQAGMALYWQGTHPVAWWPQLMDGAGICLEKPNVCLCQSDSTISFASIPHCLQQDLDVGMDSGQQNGPWQSWLMLYMGAERQHEFEQFKVN
jgi:hypothetical protein